MKTNIFERKTFGHALNCPVVDILKVTHKRAERGDAACSGKVLLLETLDHTGRLW